MASQLYYIKLTYKTFSFKVLIDSGAQISIISPNMVRFLGLQMKHQSAYVNGVGKGKVIGYIDQCKMIINKLPVMINFKVLQCDVDKNLTILGLDFLEKYKCIINCVTKSLLINYNTHNYNVKFLTTKELIQYKLSIDHKKLILKNNI
jgi:hypothetical protein